MSTECLTPLSNSYRPEPDVTAEPKAKGGHYHQKHFDVLRWIIEIGRVDILLGVYMVLAHLSLPIEGHLHIFGFLKAHKTFRLTFDLDHPKISTHQIQII